MRTHELAKILLSHPDQELVVHNLAAQEDETWTIDAVKQGVVGAAEDWNEDPEGESDLHIWNPQPCLIITAEWDDHKMHRVN